jgi:hypothetical protein
MTEQHASSPAAPASSRIDEFRDGVAGLDVPTASPRSESWVLYAGIALVVVGAIAIFAGYWGASGTVSPAEQLPYMLSGGAIGLALVVVGAVLIGRYSMARLFRYWLALLVAEHRAQTDRLVDALRDAKGR